MTAAELRRLCLSQREATEDRPFGPETTVFRVGGKMFAITSLDGDPPSVSLKCDPDLAERLRASYPAVTPGYHLNKRHWNTVVLDGTVPDAMVGDLVDESWELVVAGLPKAERERLGAG